MVCRQINHKFHKMFAEPLKFPASRHVDLVLALIEHRCERERTETKDIFVECCM